MQNNHSIKLYARSRYWYGARGNILTMELVNGKIQDIPGVAETETLISLEESFSREIPVEQKAIIDNENSFKEE